jgi:hypothetical protein
MCSLKSKTELYSNDFFHQVPKNWLDDSLSPDGNYKIFSDIKSIQIHGVAKATHYVLHGFVFCFTRAKALKS